MRRVGGRGYVCSFIPTWEQLRAEVIASPPAAILVVDPYAGSTPENPQLAGDLRTLLWEFPSATVLAAVQPSDEPSGKGLLGEVVLQAGLVALLMPKVAGLAACSRPWA